MADDLGHDLDEFLEHLASGRFDGYLAEPDRPAAPWSYRFPGGW
jgi:hypothetical protein